MRFPPLPDALPAPRRPSPDSVPSLRWGVLGTGWIAERFVAALRASTTRCVVDPWRAATKRSAIHPVPSTPQRRLGTEPGDGRRGAGRASGSGRDDTAYLLGRGVRT